MKTKDIFKKYGAYIVAAVIFVTMSLIYCSPALKGEIIYTGDKVNFHSTVKESLDYHKQTGDYTWWNASLFSGMPNYQIGGGHYLSDTLLLPLRSIFHRGHGHPQWIFITYFFCFFILLLCFGVNKWLSIVGAIAIALSSYFIVIIGAAHNTKTSTIALMSVVIGGFYLINRKKYGLGFILTMIFTAMSFSSHPQMAYYIFMLIGLLWCAELWTQVKEKRVRDFIIATALFCGAVIIGMGTGSANVFANQEYATQTMRGGHSDIVREGEEEASANSKGLDIEYATQWSYGFDETLSFIIPGVLGGSTQYPVGTDSDIYRSLIKNGLGKRDAKEYCYSIPMYWGKQPFTSGNVYMGAIVCFLFLLGLMVVKGPYKWALLLATIFSTLLALGHNFMWFTELFFKYFPLYNKFRTVSSILVVAEIAMPLLGFMAIRDIMNGKVEKTLLNRSILVSGGITAGICLLVAVLGGSLWSFTSPNDISIINQIPDWLYKEIVRARHSLLVSDSLRSAGFIAAGTALLWFWNKGKIGNALMIATLGVLIVADMWPVDKRYLNDSYFSSPKQENAIFAKQSYEKEILNDPDPYFRVMNLTVNPFSDVRTSMYLKSIGGYSAAKLRRYQDLIDEHLSKMHMPVINMLNTKYIIYKGKDGTPTPTVNPGALGNAWFVSKLVPLENANKESEALMLVDLSNTAVLDKSFSSYVQNFNPSVPEDAYVKLTSFTPKTLEYVSESSEDGTIVFSEVYYPYGWKATIDGQPVEHYRVNYLLRALNVPAGKHYIKFVFDPDSVKKGDSISMVFIILMYLITAVLTAFAIWKKLRKSS